MPKKNVIKKTALSPTVLIAGGAGFIGSHLVEIFLNNGARVIVLDNFKTGKDIHVKSYIGNPNFALYDVDINNGLPPEIESVDYVVHLAGLEEYLYSKDLTDLNTLLTNSVGTKNLLDFALSSKAKFLLVSSVDVYLGRMSQIELNEYFGKSSIDENKYMVTEAKRYAEALAWEFYKKHKLDIRIVRLPEIYGPKMNLDASGSLGRHLRDLIEGRNLTVYGDGDAAQFYLYVGDAVSGIVKSLFTEGTAGNIYSLVSQDPVTDVELAYIVKGLADREVLVNFEPKPDQKDKEPLPNKPDMFNLKDLEWLPKVEMKDGLYKTLEWLGYQPNDHSFKPAKLIEDKQLKKRMDTVLETKPTETSDLIFSLQGVKPDIPVSAPAAPVMPTANTIPTAPFNHAVSKINLVPKGPGIFSKLKNVPAFSFIRNYSMPILGVTAALFAAIIAFVLIPVSLSLYHAQEGAKDLKNAGKMAGSLNTVIAMDSARSAYKHFYEAKKSVAGSGWVFKLVGKGDFFYSYTRTVSSLAYFSKASYTLADAIKPFESLWETVRPDTASEIDIAAYDAARLQITNAKVDVQLAQADLKYVNANALPKELHSEIQTYTELLNLLSTNLDIGEKLVAEVPGILGAKGEKKYLILFQNTNEVRATGGFIGSYGILTFSNGKIKNLEIDDIYNPDGQIDVRNIKVTAPKQIEQYLKEDRMHLRNANWDPDFTVSASNISDLYFKVTGEQVDGVIALDLSFVRDFLRVTGPVFLTAYSEEINADNLYERTQLHSDFNYTNGSEQKKSFLTVLGSKLLEKFFSLPKDQIPALATMLLNSADSRHILISLNNSPVNALLTNNRWNGGLVTTDGDYLSIINSNVGGTKANYYVKNNYLYRVTSQTRDGLLRGIVRMEYVHTGQDGAWPGGPYTNYVRVLTQKDAKLTGATIKFSDKDTEENIMPLIETDNSGAYKYYGYTFVLDPAKSVVLTISYDLPAKLSLTADNKEYKLFWQKQAGVDKDSAQFVFDFPLGMEVVERTQGFVTTNDEMQFNTDLNNDRSFYVKLR